MALEAWEVPPKWKGQTVVIMASGPSMSQEIADQVYASELPTIVVNDTYRLAPWADLHYAADSQWWEVNEAEIVKRSNSFPPLRVTASLRCRVTSFPIKKLQQTGTKGFDPNPKYIRTGGNSGYQAVHLAIHTGAAQILLCGYDMQPVGGKHHWFGSHTEHLHDPHYTSYEVWPRRFEAFVGLTEILNCTPGSAIKCFPFVALEDAL